MKNSRVILIISAIEMLFCKVMLDFHYGWVDDVFCTLRLKGEVISPPTGYFYGFIHNYVGFFYRWLYNSVPEVNWYGIIFLFYAFLIVFSINYLLHRIFRPAATSHLKLGILLSVSFFFAIVVENVYLINFTRIAILLAGTALLNIWFILEENEQIDRRTKRKLIFFGVLFFIGFNTRPTIVMLWMPLFLLAVGMSTMTLRRKLRLSGITIGFAFLITLLTWMNHSPRVKEYMRFHNHFMNLLDGYNYYDLSGMDDAFIAKYNMLRLWFFADEENVANKEFLEKLGSGTPLTQTTLKNWKWNLGSEIAKTNAYNKDYHFHLNYYHKTWFYVILLLLAPFFSVIFFRSKRRGFYSALAVAIATLTYLVGITLMFKMEDRVLNPFLILLLLQVLYFLSRDQDKPVKAMYFFIGLFVVVSLFRIPRYGYVSEDSKEEVLKKRAVVAELNELFPDEVVFFDLFSATVLHDNLVTPAHFNNPNWISYIEAWNTLSEEHHARIDSLVGCHEMECFFNKTCASSDRYVFFMSKERVDMLETYYDKVLGRSLGFQRIDNTPAIDSLEYSFLPGRRGLGYYRICSDSTALSGTLLEPEGAETPAQAP